MLSNIEKLHEGEVVSSPGNQIYQLGDKYSEQEIVYDIGAGAGAAGSGNIDWSPPPTSHHANTALTEVAFINKEYYLFCFHPSINKHC